MHTISLKTRNRENKSKSANANFEIEYLQSSLHGGQFQTDKHNF